MLRTSLTDALGSPVRGSVGAIDLGDLDVSAILPARPPRAPTPTAFIEEQRALDLRRWLSLCAGIEENELDSLVAGDLRVLPELYANDDGRIDLEPAAQEVAFARQDAQDRFQLLVQALESRLHDAEGCAVREGRFWRIDPNVVEDVLASPTTPGGEPWTLSDLTNIDPQVSFHNMARRVSRRKLMEALLSMQLQDDPPSDPRAAMRAMFERFTPPLDPWRRRLRFLPGAPGVRFLTPPGLGLCSAGPDGVFSTHDDLCGPFQRVLKAGSVYARATEALYERGLRRPRCHQELCEDQPALLGAPYIATVVGGWLEPPTRVDSEGHAQLIVPLGPECRLGKSFVYGLSEAGCAGRGRAECRAAVFPGEAAGNETVNRRSAR